MTVDWAFCRKVLGDDGYWFPCTALIISHNNKTYCALVYGLGKRRMIV